MTASAEVLWAEYAAERKLWEAGERWRTSRVRQLFERWFHQSVVEDRPPDALARRSKNEVERFFAFVVEGPDGHAYWVGRSLDFRTNAGRKFKVRRWWWEHVHGPGDPNSRTMYRPACGDDHCVHANHQEAIPWSNGLVSFTHEQLIGSLQVAHMRLGRSPSRWEYDKLGLRPAGRTIVGRLGSWGRALSAAGLEPQNRDKWSRDECIEALRAWARENGHVSTRAEWRAAKIQPSDNTIIRRVGSWSEAVRIARS